MSIIFKIIIFLFVAFIVIFILFVFGSLIGTGFLIGRVYKKSVEVKSDDFLKNEKREMNEKVNELKKTLKNWNSFTIFDITNNLNYSYKRWITSKLTGQMFSQGGEPVIAFQRVQRGNHIDCRILACSTEFKFFYEMSNNEIKIEYNDQYFGKIEKGANILDPSGIRVGLLNRNTSADPYVVKFGSGKEIEIRKSYDNKAFITNVFFDRVNSPFQYRRHMKTYREPYSAYSLINCNIELSPDEMKWVVAIGTLESIFYSFKFTS